MINKNKLNNKIILICHYNVNAQSVIPIPFHQRVPSQLRSFHPCRPHVC